MTVLVEFHLDTRTETEVIRLRSPFADRGKAADKVQNLLEETSKSSSAMMQMRDADTGDYVMVNTMKLAHCRIYEQENGDSGERKSGDASTTTGDSE